MIFPSLEIFRELSKQGNLIPVYEELIADTETPVSAYLKLDQGEHTFLLESVESGGKFSRYSFVGAEPSVVFTMRGSAVTVTDKSGTRTYGSTKGPLGELQMLMSRYKPITFGELPIFYGGAVGFLSYESVRFFEPTVGVSKSDQLLIPDSYFVISDSILIFDHQERKLKVLVNAYVEGNPDRAYAEAVAKIEHLLNRLRQPIANRLLPSAQPKNHVLDPQANMTQDEYVKMTERMQEYIKAGDIFQVVPSQRFAVPFEDDPIELYRALRVINPSPYMFCLKFGKLSIVGSSPEVHVRCENGKVKIRPIAGTRPRKIRPEEDELMARELLADPNERAEHVMLVDLARNDVGRVCDFHSVKVTDFMIIERYSHVMHIVSNVEGNLKPGYSVYDVMRATFPAGTVSGSPKVRAMQIIAELEPTCRGVYAGAVGYFGFSGNLDSCIAIRTIVIRDGMAYVQAGGGLVADSTPMGEYQESVNKAKAALKSLAMAKGF